MRVRVRDNVNKDMKEISICIICFNEEARIEDCLKSATWADEIIVVDSLSTDRTVEVCKKYTKLVISNPWPGYVAQKNFVLEKANCQWVLSLDADERVSDQLREEILALRKVGLGKDGCDGYYMPRKTFYLNRWMTHSGWYPDYKLRLFNKEKGTWGGLEPHDKVSLKGKAGYLKGELLHYSFNGLSHHLEKIDHFTTIAAKEAFLQGKRSGPGSLATRPLFTFFKMFILKMGFLDGLPGLIAAGMSAFHVFSKYAKLWELQRRSK